jgi:hypothetical protein
MRLYMRHSSAIRVYWYSYVWYFSSVYRRFHFPLFLPLSFYQLYSHMRVLYIICEWNILSWSLYLVWNLRPACRTYFSGQSINFIWYTPYFLLSVYLWIVARCLWPPLWSSGQSSWLQIRRPGLDSRHYQKKKVVGLGLNGVHSALWVQLRSYLIEK